MGFIFNDITSGSMGIKARLTSWQVCGKMRNFTTTVPGKYGVADFGADFDYREINVHCNIYPKHNFTALVSALDDIAAWLDPVQGLRQLILMMCQTDTLWQDLTMRWTVKGSSARQVLLI